MDVLIIGLILVAATGGPDNEIQELHDLVNELREEVAELRNNQEAGWGDEQRAIEIRGLVGDVLTDADARLNLQGSGALSGYNKGAFFTSSDGNWKVKMNGQIPFRESSLSCREGICTHGSPHLQQIWQASIYGKIL